ncbi:MAG: 5'/3'-nucleotidase SurE [bacterium]|nr:5'/3'-nucleotidase SurE [bacterium]
MRILLSNDDGIHAPGLQVLKEALEPLCELWVVAPSSQQSATSHSLTLGNILRRRQWSERVFSVQGTPADSVLMAINGVMQDTPPDVVISGINHGPNMGEDVHYSGTVAAAIEAAILGVPAVAVSVASFREQVWDGAVRYICELVSKHEDRIRAKGTLLNVNVPNLPYSDIKGVSATHLGSRFYGDVIIRKEDPRGKDYFWIGGEEPTWIEDRDSDFYAVHREERISVTPLRLDLTDRKRIADLKEWVEG